MGPGGATARELMPRSHEPAGAAPRPASRTPHDAPFKWTRWHQSKGGSDGGDKLVCSALLKIPSSCPAEVPGIHDLRAVPKSKSWMAGPSIIEVFQRLTFTHTPYWLC